MEPAEETSLPRYQRVTVTLSSAPRSSSEPRRAAPLLCFLFSISLNSPESRVVARVLTRARLVTLRARAPPRGTRVRRGGAPRPCGCGLPLQLTRDPGTGRITRGFSLTVRVPLGSDHGDGSCICTQILFLSMDFLKSMSR